MSRRRRDFVTRKHVSTEGRVLLEAAAGIMRSRFLETMRALNAQGHPAGNAYAIAKHAAAARARADADDVAADRRSPVSSQVATATPHDRIQDPEKEGS